MQYSKSGLTLTKGFEGCRLTAYADQCPHLHTLGHVCNASCPGVWTIGYGHTHGVKPGDTCTIIQAEQYLLSDLAVAVAVVNAVVRVPLTQGEFDGLVDFEFNTGKLVGSTMLTLLNMNKFIDAANQFQRWDHAGGKEMAGLLKRRLAERDEFLGDTNATSTPAPQLLAVTTGNQQPVVPAPPQSSISG